MEGGILGFLFFLLDTYGLYIVGESIYLNKSRYNELAISLYNEWLFRYNEFIISL